MPCVAYAGSHVRVITIANLSPAMLLANAEHAGLTSLFDGLISTDLNHTYKPDPRPISSARIAYIAKEDIAFAAFGGWDAAGGKSFGYPTVWVNRLDQPHEQLGIPPDRTVSNLQGLLEYVLNTPPGQPQRQ